MVSSVVGFYSSPLFISILPRAKDTNLTQVSLTLPFTRRSWQRCAFLPLTGLLVSFQIIANCVSLLILSSALPVFSRTLGKDAAFFLKKTSEASIRGYTHVPNYTLTHPLSGWAQTKSSAAATNTAFIHSFITAVVLVCQAELCMAYVIFTVE